MTFRFRVVAAVVFRFVVDVPAGFFFVCALALVAPSCTAFGLGCDFAAVLLRTPGALGFVGLACVFRVSGGPQSGVCCDPELALCD